MSKYSEAVKQASEFFKNELNLFNFSFIGTSVYITLSKENLPFDVSLLKNISSQQFSSFINKQKVLHDSYESVLKDLEHGKTEFIFISGEAKLPLFHLINDKFVEIYKSK